MAEELSEKVRDLSKGHAQLRATYPKQFREGYTFETNIFIPFGESRSIGEITKRTIDDLDRVGFDTFIGERVYFMTTGQEISNPDARVILTKKRE